MSNSKQVFYGYFGGTILNILNVVYLPIYFLNVLTVNPLELAFVQLFSYSMLLIKPLLSVHLDKQDDSPGKIRVYALLGAIGMIGFFFMALMNSTLLLLFGILLGLYFIFAALMDVSLDKGIVKQSENQTITEKSALMITLGGLLGSIFGNVLFLLFVSDVHSLAAWNLFFMMSFLSVTPLVLLLMWFHPEKTSAPPSSPVSNEPEGLPAQKIMSKEFLLMCVFVFFLNAEELYQYPLEPWAIDRLGPSNAWLLSVFYIIFILINTVFVLLVLKIGKKFNRRKVLIYSIAAYCGLTIIAPWLNIMVFLLLIALQQVFAAFLLIYYTALMIQVSNKRVLLFQLLASVIILSKIIFTPLGTALTTMLTTEWIITLAGILQSACIIPLLFIKREE